MLQLCSNNCVLRIIIKIKTHLALGMMVLDVDNYCIYIRATFPVHLSPSLTRAFFFFLFDPNSFFPHSEGHNSSIYLLLTWRLWVTLAILGVSGYGLEVQRRIGFD